MNCILSIIIPMYNSEKYICNCIDSIIKSKMCKYEIIIIDDGSTDSSLKLVEQNYSILDNVYIFKQNNKGVSEARNLGIKKAKGKYITFVDSDDTVDSNVYCNIVNNMFDDIDLVIFDYNIINNSNTTYKKIDNDKFGILTINEFTFHFFEYFDKLLTNTNWNKLYKKSIIENNNIKFDKNMTIGEDACFNFNYLLYVKKIYVSNSKIYNYVIHNGQTIHKIHYNYYESMNKLYSNIRILLENNSNFYVNEKNFYNHFYHEIINSIKYICKTNISFSNKIKCMKNIFNDNMYKQCIRCIRKDMRYYILHYFPYILLFVYCFMYRLKKIKDNL